METALPLWQSQEKWNFDFTIASPRKGMETFVTEIDFGLHKPLRSHRPERGWKRY